MATVQDWIDRLREQDPGFLGSLSDEQKSNVRDMAERFLTSQDGGSFDDFVKELQTHPVYANWQGGQSVDPPHAPGGGTGGGDAGGGDGFTPAPGDPTTFPGGHRPGGSKGGGGGGGVPGGGGSGGGGDGTGGGGPGGGPPPPPPPPPIEPPQPPPGPTPEQSQLLAQISSLLQQWSLPPTLVSFIQSEITASKSYDEILNDLRSTAEYKAAFPENPQRIANGYSALSEQQILEYRDQAKQIAKNTLGIDVSNSEITGLISNNKSLSEWNQNLQTYKSFERYGPAVKQALSQELGYDVSDDRVFAFMSPDTPTPELDVAYEKALDRGRPAQLGLGLRPEQEADVLIAHGIDPNKAFEGYQGIASELPRQTRLAAIDAAISGANVPDSASQALDGSTYGDLFKAIQLQDPEATARLSATISRNTALWQAGGGALKSGSVAAGLLSKDERNNY
jgi:hypothetical protein